MACSSLLLPYYPRARWSHRRHTPGEDRDGGLDRRVGHVGWQPHAGGEILTAMFLFVPLAADVLSGATFSLSGARPSCRWLPSWAAPRQADCAASWYSPLDESFAWLPPGLASHYNDVHPPNVQAWGASPCKFTFASQAFCVMASIAPGVL